MMSLKRIPVPILAGDDVQFHDGRYRFTTNGVPDDLTLWTDWRAQWRPEPESETVHELEVDLSEGAAGYVTITAPAAVTRAMGRDGVWDIQAKRDGKVRTFHSGTTVWSEDVTRD